MNKIANQKLDFLDENNQSLGFDYTPPANDRDYALIIKIAGGDIIKKYPVNNHQNLIFSYASYLENRPKLSSGMQKTAEEVFASKFDLYGIPHTIECEKTAATNVYEMTRKDEVELAKFAEPTEFALNEFLPIDTPGNLKRSMYEFFHKKHLLNVPQRKEAADNMVKKAAEFHMDAPIELYRYASYKPADMNGLKNALSTRFIKYPTKVAGFIREVIDKTPVSKDSVIKLAEAIENVDTMLGIKKGQHPDPSMALFVEKTAEEKKNMKLQKLANVGVFDDLLDESIVNDIKENGSAAVDKLSKMDQKVIYKFIK